MENVESGRHGVAAALQAVGGKWKPLLLFILLGEGEKRFGELRRLLPGITHGMLAIQLKELEQDGLVIRTAYPEVPPRVEYALSPHGRTLEPVLRALCSWGYEHLDFSSHQEGRRQG